jgi:hypothetical protein
VFKELRVLIKPETRRYPFDKVKIYGSFGKDSNSTSQNNDFESFPLWEDAEGVYLFRSRTQGTDNELHPVRYDRDGLHYEVLGFKQNPQRLAHQQQDLRIPLDILALYVPFVVQGQGGKVLLRELCLPCLNFQR